MNKRITEIIGLLKKKDGSIKELMNNFQVSERTIRSDIAEINGLLQENGMQKLEIKKGDIIIRPSDFYIIEKAIPKNDFYSYKLSKAERVQVAATLLICAPSYITLADIADNLFVSRRTVINDLEELKKYLVKNNLELISQPNKGLKVNGSENYKRKVLLKLANSTYEESKTIVSKYISVQGGHQIIISKIITEQEHVYKVFLTDDSFQRLNTYLGIVISRNISENYIEENYIEENMLDIEEKFSSMAKDILKYICQYCNINLIEAEINYLGFILSTSQYIKKELNQVNNVQIQLLTRQFINAVSKQLHVNLNDDYDFFENLSNHLQSIFLAMPPVYPDNEIISELIEENIEVFYVVKENISILTKFIERKISDMEISYIVVHVCAALLRKKNNEVKFRVIVACNSSYGTSRLILEKLKKHFDFQIVDIISSHDAQNLPSSIADLIISTVPIRQCSIDHVVVTAMFNDQDYLRVANKIETLRNSRDLSTYIESREFSANGLLREISPILDSLIPNQSKEVFTALKRVVRRYFKQVVDNNVDILAPSLHHLLTASHITLDVECTDWRDAVRKSAQVLLEKDYIEPRYIDAMIENIEENGPYIVISPNFAVPHTGLECGTIKVGMSLIRLTKPVNFGLEEHDPVEFVCCLSAVDSKTHLKAFFGLVNMLQNPDFKQRLRECKNSAEVAEVIEQYEYIGSKK